jgi:hypothetical protein
MLGPVKPRRVGQLVVASLDALVPADHFYRHLERTLDLSFVRDLARDAYAAGGGSVPARVGFRAGGSRGGGRQAAPTNAGGDAPAGSSSSLASDSALR